MIEKTLESLTKDQKSLLLYFESCTVDYGGKVDLRRMNEDEIYIAKQWDKQDFIQFGRIKFSDIVGHNTHYVFLSENAWNLAHEERRARFNRLNEKRNWIAVKEL